MTFRHVLLLPLLVLLAACQPRMLDVNASGTIDEILISASLPRDLFEFSVKPAHLHQVEVRDWTALAAHPGTSQPQPQMWLIEAPSCQSAVTYVRYGTVPTRFAVRTPAQALREGGSYMVRIEGCDNLHNMGIATFRITDGRVVEFTWR